MTTVETYFKQKPIRLSPYKLMRLKAQCLERDKVCQYSNEPFGLQMHHIVFLSQSGSDILENVIMVTIGVHDRIHKQGTLKVTGKYPKLTWTEL